MFVVGSIPMKEQLFLVGQNWGFADVRFAREIAQSENSVYTK